MQNRLYLARLDLAITFKGQGGGGSLIVLGWSLGRISQTFPKRFGQERHLPWRKPQRLCSNLIDAHIQLLSITPIPAASSPNRGLLAGQ